MSTDRVNGFIKRYDIASGRADLWSGLLDDAYEYIIPDKNIINRRTEGEVRNARVFDSTATLALNSFVSKIHNSLTPPGINWAKFVAGTELNEKESEVVNQQLTKVTENHFKFLNQSNFDLAINEAYSDLAIGTGAIQIVEGESDDQPLKYIAVPMAQISPEPGPWNDIRTVWRRFDMVRGSDIKVMWRDAKLTSTMRQQIGENPNATFDLIEGEIYEPGPTQDKDIYRYIVIERTQSHILVERESPSPTWVVFRWSVLPGEVFGRGPGIMALPNVQTLNRIAEFELKAAQLAIAPPFIASRSGAFNPYTARIMPNTIIPVDSVGIGEREPIRPLMTAPNIQFGQLLVQDLRQQINAAFFTKPLGPVEGPARTATEITVRQRELVEEIGPAFGRLQVELLRKVVNRNLFILQKRGLIQNIRVDGKDVGIKYQSVLEESQEREDVQTFQQYFGLLAEIFGQQLAVGALDSPAIPSWLAEKMNVDLRLIKTSDQINQMIQQATQAEQQQQQQLPQEAPGGSTPAAQAVAGQQQIQPG